LKVNDLKLTATQSQLVVVDIQTKLVAAMPADATHRVIKNAQILLQAAQSLEISAIISEQYPQGLGATVPALAAFVPPNNIISKTVFSCCGEPKFNQHLQSDKPQIVLVGMEAHICLLQTALDLNNTDLKHADLTVLKKQIFVVEDAIISRDPANKANAIARMRDAGCVITNTESVLFEWLGNAEHPAFKALSKLIR
jgi:nicotinamidase-related amidase